MVLVGKRRNKFSMTKFSIERFKSVVMLFNCLVNIEPLLEGSRAYSAGKFV
jgi:hypothetical protein